LPADPAAPVERSSPPRTTRDAGAWLMCSGAGFLAGQVVSAFLVVVVAAVNGHSGDVSQLAARPVPPAWIVVSGLAGVWCGFVGGVVLASRLRGTRSLRRDMGLEVRPWDVVIGPIVGLVGQLVLLPVLYLPLEHVISHLDSRLSQPARHLTGGFPGGDVAFIAVLTVLVVPVIEELFFRGLLLRSLLKLFEPAGAFVGPALAVTLSGAVFGLAHFELLQLLGLAVFGVVLSAMAYKFKRLGPSIFAHATFNLLAVLSVAFPTGVRP
jgi:membrane protease YdiL (CAAX protease family)